MPCSTRCWQKRHARRCVSTRATSRRRTKTTLVRRTNAGNPLDSRSAITGRTTCTDEIGEALHGGADALPGGVDDDAVACPGVIVARYNLVPRQRPARKVRRSRFHASSMFDKIWTRHFDVDGSGVRGLCRRVPRGPGNGEWVDGIGNHRAAESQVVGGYGVGDAVSAIVDAHAGAPDLVLDRIDAHVHRVDAPGELAGDSCLARRGKTAEDDEHRHILSYSESPPEGSDLCRPRPRPAPISTCCGN